MKIIINIFFIFYCFTLNSFEIIRDPIFESYLNDLNNKKNNLKGIYLVNSDRPNAFVIEDSIYFTTEMIKLIEDEETLRSIFYHELGHIINNHFNYKKNKIKKINDRQIIKNLISIGVVVMSGDPNLGIASNLTIDKSLMNNLSLHSINYEIQADEYMIDMIKRYKINTKGLIKLLKNLPKNKNNYFKSHPNNSDRINILSPYTDYSKNQNSSIFEWIKAKYSHNSKINKFNKFFKNLDKGIYNSNIDLNEIDPAYINYELYKKGLFKNDNENIFKELININDNSYLKIEYFNYLIDNNIKKYFYLIDKEKHENKFQKEYYFYYLLGKYYDKLENDNLSNYYFCQFYQLINLNNKSDFFCNIYDINNISKLDKSYGIFK